VTATRRRVDGNTPEIVSGDVPGETHQGVTRLRQSLLKLLSNPARFAASVTLSDAQPRRNDGDWIGIAAPNSAIGNPAGKLDQGVCPIRPYR